MLLRQFQFHIPPCRRRNRRLSVDKQCLDPEPERFFVACRVNLHAVITSHRMRSLKPQTVSPDTFHFADKQPPVPDKMCVNHVFILAVKMEPAPWPRKNLPDVFRLFQVLFAPVENMAIIVRNRRNIQRRLFPPFNFERQRRDFQNRLLQRQIFHGKQMRP